MNGPVPIGWVESSPSLSFGTMRSCRSREDVGEARIGNVEVELDRLRIDRRDIGHHRQVGAGARARGRIEDALHGGDHVVGIENAAVVELDALAQLEGPGLQVVRRGPALGEVGLHRHVRVDARQAVEDEMDVDVFVADRGLGRVESGSACVPSATRRVPCAWQVAACARDRPMAAISVRNFRMSWSPLVD